MNRGEQPTTENTKNTIWNDLSGSTGSPAMWNLFNIQKNPASLRDPFCLLWLKGIAT